MELKGKDLSILDAEIIYESRNINKFSFNIIKENKIGVDFNFLDRNDGAIVQLIHTGSGYVNVIVNGTIKGNKNKKIQKNFDSSFEKNFADIMERVLPSNDFLDAIIILLLLPLIIPIFTLGYLPEMIFKYSKRLPQEFVLSSKK